MPNTVNYHVLMNSVVVNFNGKTVSIHKDDPRYKNVLLAIKESRLDTIPDLVDIATTLSKQGFDVVNNSVQVDGQELPKALSDRIIEFSTQGLPFAPLLKLWDNLKTNPSFNSKQMLYKFLEHNGHPITEDGCFIAYRGVTEDFKDLHTRTFNNNIGSVCEMPRSEVDDNPDNTCSSGLHVACYDYANGFGPKMVEVKVNPKDVVCVPKDYNGTKMRVCKFEVVNVCEVINTDSLYGHKLKDFNIDFFEDDLEYYDQFWDDDDFSDDM